MRLDQVATVATVVTLDEDCRVGRLVAGTTAPADCLGRNEGYGESAPFELLVYVAADWRPVLEGSFIASCSGPFSGLLDCLLALGFLTFGDEVVE